MTLPQKSNRFALLQKRITEDPYLTFNLIITIVILVVFLYSCFFSPDSDNYPVECIHKKLTGEPCASCGLSHSFSLIVRGRIIEAFLWNAYGPRVFIFFLGQLLMRVFFSIFYLRNAQSGKSLIYYDMVVSSMLFIVCFFPFFRSILNSF